MEKIPSFRVCFVQVIQLKKKKNTQHERNIQLIKVVYFYFSWATQFEILYLSI